MKTTLDHASRAPDPEQTSSGDFDDVLRALSRAPAVRLADIDLVGRTVGRFLVKRRLGEGGMGVVYEGFDPVLGRAVALKVLRASHRGSAARARLHEEARRVAALHHPHIATVYDAGEHDGIVFLALERAAGRSLRARLAAPPPLSLPRAIAVLRAIAGGLGCAHAAGIVHRDLKPENVVVGDDGTVKIIDFGIAAAAGQSGVSTPNARPAGTRRYMAPEHAAGAPASARADVFAFGVLGREVLAATMVPARERSTRAALARFLARCTAEAAEDRPADGGALLAELDAIVSPRRGTAATTAAAAIGAAAVAAIVGLAAGRSAPAPASAQPAAPPSSAGVSQQRPRQPRGLVVPVRRTSTPDDVPDALAERDGPLDVEETPPLAPPDRPARGQRPSERSRGSLQDAGEVLLAANGNPSGFAKGARAIREGLRSGSVAIPVTTYVDERGQLVMRLGGLGGGARPVVRPGEPAGAVAQIAPFDPEGGELELVPDGEGGATLLVTVRFPSQKTAPGSKGGSPDPLGGKAVPQAGGTPGGPVGVPVGKIMDLLHDPGASSNGVQPGTSKPQGDVFGKPGMIVPLSADGMLFDIRAELLGDGALELTAEGEDGIRKLLVVLDEDGQLMKLGKGISVRVAETPGMDG